MQKLNRIIESYLRIANFLSKKVEMCFKLKSINQKGIYEL